MDGLPPDHADEQPDHGADAEAQGADQQVAGAHGDDAGRPVLRVAHGPDGEDVELEQLEQHAQTQSGLQVADDEPRPRRGDERPGDHHLGHAH